MASSPSQQLIIALLILIFAAAVSGNPPTIFLDLHHLPRPPQPDSFRRVVDLAASSLLRARRLRTNNEAATATDIADLPLSSHAFGGYTVTLGFGTPPQPIPLIIDTGSHLTWVPCTSSYKCSNCSSSPPATVVFHPKGSTTARVIGCRNPRCSWIYPAANLASCRRRSCPTANSSCSPELCPPYDILYGSGSTAGFLFSDTLGISGGAQGFAFGCSLLSVNQPTNVGLAGFGRGAVSIPAQLRLPRFSYCLVSRRFDKLPGKAGTLVLGGGELSSASGFLFTPFVENPSSGSGAVYYYVDLKKVTVGGRGVKIPREVSLPGVGGGGVIVDSGTTYTVMSVAAFEPVAAAVEAAFAAGGLNRSAEVESATGFRPCVEIPATTMTAAAGELTFSPPELVFHFKGGAEMKLPPENAYEIFVVSPPARSSMAPAMSACLAILPDNDGGGGPAVLIGEFQQQNYLVVYDLQRERLGFRQQPCLRRGGGGA